MDNFLECPGKVFLSIKVVLEKLSEGQPQWHCLIAFLLVFETKVSHFF